MSRWLTALMVIVVALCLALPAQAQTTQRPLADFLAAQGKTPPLPPNSYVPPDPNFLGCNTILSFLAPIAKGYGKKSSPIYFAGVDYAGLAATYENSLGNPYKMKVPEITGTVTERPLSDGTAEITVIMHTTGANIWVIQLGNDPNLWGYEIAGTTAGMGPTLFGHRPRDVAQGKQPALADVLLHVVFTIAKPGDPLPDLLAINYTPAEKFVAFNAHGEGPLTVDYGVPDGTPGKCQITQTGLFDVTFKQISEEFKGKAGLNSRVAYDFFPVENINLQVVGKGK